MFITNQRRWNCFKNKKCGSNNDTEKLQRIYNKKVLR